MIAQAKTASLLAALTLFAWTENMTLAAETFKGYGDGVVNFSGGEYENEVFHYRLLRPADPEPGAKYPLVVFLHGAGLLDWMFAQRRN